MTSYSWQHMFASPAKTFKSLNARRKALLDNLSESNEKEKSGTKKEEKEWIALVAERDKVLKEVIAKENRRILDAELGILLKQMKVIGTCDHSVTPQNLKLALCRLYRELQSYLQNKPHFFESSLSDIEADAVDTRSSTEKFKDAGPGNDATAVKRKGQQPVLSNKEYTVSAIMTNDPDTISPVESKHMLDGLDIAPEVQNDLSNIVHSSSPSTFVGGIERDASKVLNVDVDFQSIGTSTNVSTTSESFLVTDNSLIERRSEAGESYIGRPQLDKNVVQIEEVIERVKVEAAMLSAPRAQEDDMSRKYAYNESTIDGTQFVPPRCSSRKESTDIQYEAPHLPRSAKGSGVCIDVTDANDLVTVAQREQFVNIKHVYKSLFQVNKANKSLDETRETNETAAYESDDSVD